MSNTIPKPGPHLIPVPPNPAAILQSAHGTFRDIAKRHANAADAILSTPAADDLVTEELDYLAAIAHALTAIAYTELAPPRRRPFVHTVTPSKPGHHE